MPRVNESPKPCKICGKPMRRKRFNGRLEDLGAFRRRNHCSRICGNSRLSVGDSALLKRARRHVEKSCSHCGGDFMLAAHHKDGNRENNAAENIETLCVRCHARLHHGTLEGYGAA